ncbi:GDYXXLXY domain-containing protein [Sulfurospirillum diekertiae]|uniref:GDYXXLXY domain-containing protein n=1 Tax=Sulfurospirillum diekertiae TaxID=1854492 RepID=A0A6G9VRB1_9BACT|nr:GDYXXLXY domain-containing protein [Sulfurospirillum diekertiae]QIR75492.1 GDYXXLXY domain-containing protein [Sulfurospirillum diekertiae]QIR78143.1 GDYXXLXY domain-containing protein [Sulfurospirillum diekertiae]
MKNMKLLSWICFGLLCVVQLGVIVFQIMSYERILKEGEVFYLKVSPLDPYDPFRGRYVTLRFDTATKAPLAEDETMREHSKAYAIFEHSDQKDSIKEIRFTKPLSGNFLEVNVHPLYQGMTQKEDLSRLVSFSLPFDRFYMREELAPKAEKVLRQNSGITVRAKLRILEGKGVIEDLMVADTPLSQFVLEK